MKIFKLIILVGIFSLSLNAKTLEETRLMYEQHDVAIEYMGKDLFSLREKIQMLNKRMIKLEMIVEKINSNDAIKKNIIKNKYRIINDEVVLYDKKDDYSDPIDLFYKGDLIETTSEIDGKWLKFKNGYLESNSLEKM